MRRARVQFYRDRRGEWRWRVRAGNGRIVAQGEGHPTRAKAIRAFNSVVWNVADAYNNRAGLPLEWEMLAGRSDD